MQYNTIDEALEALRQGQCILVIDDPDRENEGDLICAAQFATTENVNLMASLAKGLICMPMSRELCERLNLPQMVTHNSDNHQTAFTVSVDHISTTTGISAVERGITARAIADPSSKPIDFRRPGHMFPLQAREGGVLVLKLLPQDPHAKLHALIADPDAGALDHAVDLLLVLAAEGAAQGFLCVVTHAITSKSG